MMKTFMIHFSFITAVFIILLLYPLNSEGQNGYTLLRSWPEDVLSLNNPCGIAVDVSGNVYVVDTANSRIQKLDPKGRLLMKWGEEGSGKGQFQEPCGIAVDSSGNIYITDSGNHRIQKFDSEGNLLTVWGNFRWPYGIATDSSRSVYIVDSGNNRIRKHDSDGGYQATPGSLFASQEFRKFTGIAVDTSGDIYVTGKYNRRVMKLNSSGKTLAKWGKRGTRNGQFEDPSGIAVDASGNVYVVDTANNCVQKFDLEGNFLAKWGTGELSKPYDVAVVDTSGIVYVSDSGNNCIRAYISESAKPLLALDQALEKLEQKEEDSSDDSASDDGAIELPEMELAIVKTQFDDSTFGNKDGDVEAGEMIELKVTIDNKGSGVVKGVAAKLLYSGAGVDAIIPWFQLRNIQPGESNTRSFIFSISQDYSDKELVFQIELSGESGYKLTEDVPPLYLKDGKKPKILVHQPINNAEIDSETVQFKADITDNVAVTSYDVKVNNERLDLKKPDKTGASIDTTVSLQPGDNTIYIQASDSAGNRNEKTVNVYRISLEAQLIITKTEINDASLGNGNREVETGETVLLIITVKNEGPGIAKDVNIKPIYKGVGVQVRPSSFSLNDIQPGSSEPAVFTISVPLTYKGEEVSVQIELSDKRGYKSTEDIPPLYIKDDRKPRIVIHEPISKTQTGIENVSLRADITDNKGIVSVDIEINGEIIKSQKPGEDRFTIDETISLKPGDNTIRIEASDSAGNKGEETVDIHMIPPPELAVTGTQIHDDERGNGNGEMESGETVTLDITIRNSGVGAARNVKARLLYEGTDIQIKSGSSHLKDIQPGSSGAGSFTLSVLPNHSSEKAAIQIELSDETGYISTQKLAALHIKDTRKPKITVHEPDDNAKTGSQSVKLKADVIDNIQIANVDVKVNDKPILSEKPARDKHVINAVIPLETGDNTIHIEASDSVGNTDGKTISVQRTFPDLKILYVAPPDKIRSGETLDLSLSIINEGTGSAKGVRVFVQIEELGINQMGAPLGDLAPKSEKTVSMPITMPTTLEVDIVKITAYASEISGHRSEETQLFAQTMGRDNTPPEITISQPPPTRAISVTPGKTFYKYREKIITVRGKATDKSGVSKVTVNGQRANLDAEGQFWIEVSLKTGDNKLTVLAHDIYGNQNDENLTVQYERTLPSFVEGKYYGLLVAVQDYEDDSVPDLSSPIQEAREMADVLKTKYIFDESDIFLLENPDRRDILMKFRELRDKLTPEDNLLIFYAGHGKWDSDIDQGYWLPRDAKLDDPSEWLSNSTLRDQIKGIKAKHTLLISDACFSGGIFRTRTVSEKPSIFAARTVYEKPSRIAITSGDLDEVPDPSVFVKYLLKTLSANQGKYLYAQSLYTDIKDPVINNSPTDGIPQYGVIHDAGHERGDFIFILREGTVPEGSED